MLSQPSGLRRYVTDFIGPENTAETTRSLPSVPCVNDVNFESGAKAGGVGGGGGGPCCLRGVGGSLGVIATTRGPLTSEKDWPRRETATNKPVVLLICSDRSPTVAVRLSADSVAAGFEGPGDSCSRPNSGVRSLLGQTYV